mmetsp:Transcript_64875/g.193938  ORF Transcript_64875/g.193938 Transcript_64875/m.193938 type:complete len:86 (-) Transcript_64875:6-263(-)|eukprot:1649246-Prymnesium_polylepis.2
MEAAVLDGREQVSAGGISKGASQTVTAYFGMDPDTLSAWRHDFEVGGMFAPDARGKWERRGSCSSTRRTGPAAKIPQVDGGKPKY